ncbi:MAG: Cof-type HAD-IIB family hydrolase [Bacilli bacterium]
MKKLFVFDIDDTILPRGDKHIPLSTVKSINELLKNGNAICLASGRPYTGIKQYLDEFCNGEKYAIVANGAGLYTYDGKLISEKFMTPKEVYYLYDHYGHLPTTSVYAYDNASGMITFTDDKWTRHEFDVNKIQNHIEFDKKDYRNSNIKIYKTMIASESEISRNIALTKEEFKKFHPTRSTVNFYEILIKGASKLERIEDLVKYLNINENDVYTFGDNNNDSEMIEHYNGTALGNAIDECKKVAKHVTIDVKDDGVTYALKNILKVL